MAKYTLKEIGSEGDDAWLKMEVLEGKNKGQEKKTKVAASMLNGIKDGDNIEIDWIKGDDGFYKPKSIKKIGTTQAAGSPAPQNGAQNPAPGAAPSAASAPTLSDKAIRLRIAEASINGACRLMAFPPMTGGRQFTLAELSEGACIAAKLMRDEAMQFLEGK